MTQFVPVWSAARLHSRRLAVAQLWLVTGGLVGLVATFLTARLALAPVFGGALALGFWVFAYNVGRTLRTVDGYDVTERHFALALGFFLLATALGFLLALDFATPVFPVGPVTRSRVVGAHATLAVFGAVLTTVLGALYQLAPMFTQTDLHGVDVPLRRAESVGYPAGVALLAAGRLVGAAPLARLGGALVALSLLGFSAVLARRLVETRVERTPMLARYAVAAPATALWALFALRTWVRSPLGSAARFGAPGTAHLLALGVVGFVVLGTVYHVVPFVVWVHRYSDLLGRERVPTIGDLYRDDVAAADFAFLLAGTVALVAADVASLPSAVPKLGGAAVLAGATLFLGNVLWVLRVHGPDSLAVVLVGSLARRAAAPGDDGTADGD